jgi:hypothetical protein
MSNWDQLHGLVFFEKSRHGCLPRTTSGIIPLTSHARVRVQCTASIIVSKSCRVHVEPCRTYACWFMIMCYHAAHMCCSFFYPPNQMPLRIFHHGHFKKAENRSCWICQWVQGVHVGMESLLSTMCRNRVELVSNHVEIALALTRCLSLLFQLVHVQYMKIWPWQLIVDRLLDRSFVVVETWVLIHLSVASRRVQ